MNKLAIQISPEAKSAYFSDYINVAEQELRYVIGDIAFTMMQKGSLTFFVLAEGALNLNKLLKLSFVQGLYSVEDELLRPLDISPDFRLHEDFVFGSKFKGKTNERLTQMLINLGLATIGKDSTEGVSVLDPMCGRATTLLWAMRYGIKARGIEQDAKALEDIQRNLKKWTKLHRQKHKISDGFIGASKKSGNKFIEFNADDSNMRVVIGDSRQADQIFKKEKFDLIVSDLPYGIQHTTVNKSRDPISVIEQSISAWKSCLKQKGVIVLAFNSNNPKREALIQLFEQEGFDALPFSAPHRMSESIVRDILILQPHI